MAFVIIKPKREKSLQRKHPWVFSGALAKTRGNPAAGDTVDLVNARGGWLGRGAYSPQSQIIVRMWTFNEDESVDVAFFRRRLERALANRREVGIPGLNALRLVNAESDGLPGLIVDRYDRFLVCQFLAAGVHAWKTTIVDILLELVAPDGIFERSDSPVLDKEGLPRCVGVLAGKEPPAAIEIREGDFRYLVDVREGHKTGFYLDQRDNRFMVGSYVGDGDVLNCFCYTGGFGVVAMARGARTLTNIDISAAALDLAQKNMTLNGLDDPQRVDYLQADVFKQLRSFRDAARQFDLIILDPPKFADSRQQVDRACRGYKDINLLAVKLLRAGGFLLTFSCSGLMEPALFQKVVADAALDAGRDALIVRRMGQAADHPIALNFPEGHYLKGLLCRIW